MTEPSRYNQLLERAYTLSDAEEAEQLYEEWAGSYDQDLNAGEYASPQAAVDAIVQHAFRDVIDEIEILDAGCGTGLVAECLSKSELSDRCAIDGLDLTQGMLDVARKKNLYRELRVADLTRTIPCAYGSYDIVTCVGTLTKGHVGPAAFKEFVRVTTRGGLIVATVHADIWESMGYKSTVEELQDAKTVQIVSADRFEMFKNANETGRLVVLRRS